MKKAAVALVLILALVLSGCALLYKKATPKTFSKAGMSITLTSDFVEKEHVSFTVVYSSTESAVLVIKEEFSLAQDFEGFDDLTLSEYCQLVIDNNKINAEVKTDNDLTYYENEYTANGKEYKYFCPVLKSDDAFWFFQFYCEKGIYDKHADSFIEWTKSIKFDS